MRAAFVLLVVASVAAAAPVPKAVKAKLSDYYPMAEGATWEYAMGTSTVTTRATEVSEKDGVRSIKLVTEHEEKEVATERIQVTKDGVFRTHILDKEISSPVPLLKFGLTDEDGWEVKVTVDGSKVEGKFTLKGTEKVKVPTGEYEAVLVVGESTVSGTKTGTKWWIADGVGSSSWSTRRGRRSRSGVRASRPLSEGVPLGIGERPPPPGSVAAPPEPTSPTGGRWEGPFADLQSHALRGRSASLPVCGRVV